MAGILSFLIFIFIGGLVILLNMIRILKEYERGVIFRLGRLIGTKGPGLIILIPFIDQMTKIDIRIIPMDVPPQDIITSDNVPVRVNAVVYFRVMNPSDAAIKVTNYFLATSQIAQTTLRNVLGQSELDDLLTQREKINNHLQSILDEHTDPWGVKVQTVEVKDVELPQSMQRAMAKQAEAERERRAKIIAAAGEAQAAAKLTEAAHVLAESDGAMQLRYLQSLVEISTENSSTIVFPIPIDLLSSLKKIVKSVAEKKD